MVLQELTVDSLGDFAEARFALNKDELCFINENNKIIYSLGIGKESTKKENNMNKNDIRVIYNEPVTILYMNGKKYISKAHEEEFDYEKGLLMCLAKANGICHSELKRMVRNAKRQNLGKDEVHEIVEEKIEEAITCGMSGKGRKVYIIDYEYGVAKLYTPNEDWETRFHNLASQCFGIRKSIGVVNLKRVEEDDVEPIKDEYERLEHNGDIIIWNKEGEKIKTEWS